MSIWTDLLLLGGYVATPTGLAALAPATHAASASEDAEATRRPATRALPRANKISPNDLW